MNKKHENQIDELIDGLKICLEDAGMTHPRICPKEIEAIAAMREENKRLRECVSMNDAVLDLFTDPDLGNAVSAEHLAEMTNKAIALNKQALGKE